MNFTYIKFRESTLQTDALPTADSKVTGSWFIRNLKKVVFKALSSIIPLANPDFENLLANSDRWYVELDENGIPNREIGFDEQWNPIMIMPWRKNYGYWTDNNLKLEDFMKNFDPAEINKTEFEEMWNKFETTSVDKK